LPFLDAQMEGRALARVVDGKSVSFYLAWKDPKAGEAGQGGEDLVETDSGGSGANVEGPFERQMDPYHASAAAAAASG
jgi:hypothetical protein